MYCRNCGAELDDNAKFCNKCGKEIEKESQRFVESKETIIKQRVKNTFSDLIKFLLLFLIVFIIPFYIGTQSLNSNTDIFDIFESKSSKCETEAQEKSVALRDSRLNILKAKESLTKSELEEMERLEGWKKEGLHSRDDFEYYYNFCMNK